MQPQTLSNILCKQIKAVLAQISASKRFIGPDLKWVVLPEYFLTSFPFGESIPQWKNKASITINDDLFIQMHKFCVKESIFLSGNFYEVDANFPYLYFQSSFIIDDEGELILRYRRLNSMFAPTPHDVLDKYVKVYGEDSYFLLLTPNSENWLVLLLKKSYTLKLPVV